MRQNNTRLGEGIRGFFAERKVASYVRADIYEGNRQFFDRTGRVLGELPVRGNPGILGTPVDMKWRYYRPVFDKSAANPWSSRVVGLLNVHSTADDADGLFKTAEFQQQVDSITTEVSPYLDAIQVLVGEDKL